MNEIYSPGLEGVIAGETAISTVTGAGSSEGKAPDGLSYRGYAVTELAEKTTFDEVAYLLLHGELPTQAELQAFGQRVVAARQLPEPLLVLLQALPKGTPSMDALRTAVSVLANFDPEINDTSREAKIRKAERLLAQIPLAITARYRLERGEQVVTPPATASTAECFLYLLHGKEPAPEAVRAMDVSLVLYAEHEFNASAFTARVIVSTESDLHSGIVGAIGALKGRLHGGANEKVMDILQAAGGPDTAEKWVRDALARKERIMGFGHRVYKSGDVRARILKGHAQRAAEQAGAQKWEETAEIIERVVVEEKGLHPNLDWPAGRLYHALGLEIPLYTPVFVMSRVVGWAAHIIEQSSNNRLIRPRARYIGPDARPVKPIAERG